MIKLLGLWKELKYNEYYILNSIGTLSMLQVAELYTYGRKVQWHYSIWPDSMTGTMRRKDGFYPMSINIEKCKADIEYQLKQFGWERKDNLISMI